MQPTKKMFKIIVFLEVWGKIFEIFYDASVIFDNNYFDNGTKY